MLTEEGWWGRVCVKCLVPAEAETCPQNIDSFKTDRIGVLSTEAKAGGLVPALPRVTVLYGYR